MRGEKINLDYITEYLSQVLPESKGIIKELEIFAKENQVPVIYPEVRSMLDVLCKIHRPARILEIGTAVGYSASKFINMIGDNVFVDTIERNEEMFNEAEKNIEKLELSEKIDIHFGDAKEIVPTIVKKVIESNDEQEKYDMVFIDAAKSGYPLYLT